MSKQDATGTFDTSIKAWLNAMKKAGHIKPGGKLMFINKRTGTVVSAQQALPNAQNLEQPGSAGQNTGLNTSADPVAAMRSGGNVLGK